MTIPRSEFNRLKKFVKKNKYNLGKLPECLRDNRGIVLAAIRKDGYALSNASENLQRDDELIRIAVITCGTMLENGSDILKNDKDLVITAVRNDGYALQYASTTLQNDQDVVLAAVNNYGGALRYASDSLKNNRDVVIMAINSNADALCYASPTIRNDKDFVKYAIICDRHNGVAFEGASETLRDNEELVLMAINKSPHMLGSTSDRLTRNREIVKTAVSKCSTLFMYASDDLKEDKEFALFAISCPRVCNLYECKHDCIDRYHPAICYLSDTLINDIDILFSVVNISGHDLQYIPQQIIISNYKLVVYAINTSGIDVLKYVPHDNYCNHVEKNPYGIRCYHKTYSINTSGIIASSNLWNGYSTYYKLYNHIKENIQRYENFSLFLLGVCVERSQSTLKKYDFFHSFDFLRLIADFVGNIISTNDYYIYKSVLYKIHLL